MTNPCAAHVQTRRIWPIAELVRTSRRPQVSSGGASDSTLSSNSLALGRHHARAELEVGAMQRARGVRVGFREEEVDPARSTAPSSRTSRRARISCVRPELSGLSSSPSEPMARVQRDRFRYLVTELSHVSTSGSVRTVTSPAGVPQPRHPEGTSGQRTRRSALTTTRDERPSRSAAMIRVVAHAACPENAHRRSSAWLGNIDVR